MLYTCAFFFPMCWRKPVCLAEREFCVSFFGLDTQQQQQQSQQQQQGDDNGRPAERSFNDELRKMMSKLSPSSSSNLSASWLPLRRSTACECHHFHLSPCSIAFFIFDRLYSIFQVFDFSLSFHGSYTIFLGYEVPPASLPPFKRLPSELISFAALNIFQSRPC